MTGFVVRRLRDQRCWTGLRDGWSPSQDDARVFEFALVAAGVADRDCAADPVEYDIEPIYVADDSVFWRAGAA